MTGPVPPGGEELREAIRDELARHRETSEVVPGRGLRVRCHCGWAGGYYLHGYGDPAAHREWDLHQADAVLAYAEAEGRRRAAEELRALGRRFGELGQYGAGVVAMSRAAALAPEEARPE